MADNRLEFTFHQCLGKGGFGEVYLATVKRPGGLEKRAAVKVLKEGLHNEAEAVQRLQDEGRMLAFLNHPSILRAHELTRVSGRIALVTEYVEGVDLSRCAKRGRLLPPRVVLGALAEVCAALDTAWNTPSPETGNPLKLIHRDIKPENIRVTVHGQVKLLDFGIARTTEMNRKAKTQVGDLPFTPGYAAPEAFTRGVQGPASDVYALGVTMYRLLVGERLYEGMDLGNQVATAAMVDRYAPFIEKRLKNVDTGPEVVALLERMLSYEPENRPSASETGEAILEIVDNLEGATLTRWARSVTFPPPRDVKNASLTGKTVRETPLAATSYEDDDSISATFTPKSNKPKQAGPRSTKSPKSSKPRSALRDARSANSEIDAADADAPVQTPKRRRRSQSSSPDKTPTGDGTAPPVPVGLAGVKPDTHPSLRRSLQPVTPPNVSGQAKTVLRDTGDRVSKAGRGGGKSGPPPPPSFKSTGSLPDGLRTLEAVNSNRRTVSPSLPPIQSQHSMGNPGAPPPIPSHLSLGAGGPIKPPGTGGLADNPTIAPPDEKGSNFSEAQTAMLPKGTDPARASGRMQPPPKTPPKATELPINTSGQHVPPPEVVSDSSARMTNLIIVALIGIVLLLLVVVVLLVGLVAGGII